MPHPSSLVGSSLPIIAIALAVLCGACASNDPVAVAPPAPDVGLAPTGLPDWNNRGYNWIDELGNTCAEYGPGGWTPDFTFRVTSLSADESELALVSREGISLFNLRDGSWYRLANGSFRTARFSNRGNRVAALYAAPFTGVAILDLYNNQYYMVELPSFMEFLGTQMEWLPGDTTLVVTWSNSDFADPGGAAEIRIAYPFDYRDFPARTTEGYLFTRDEMAHLRPQAATADAPLEMIVTPLRDSTPVRGGSLAGVQGYKGGTISSDGNWLAFNTMVDMTGAPFPRFLDREHLLPALAVVDLRPGSPTRDMLYRVFPDPAGARNNCCTFWSYGTAPISSNGRFIYHEYIRRSDGTTQIARRNVATGEVVVISDFHELP